MGHVERSKQHQFSTATQAMKREMTRLDNEIHELRLNGEMDIDGPDRAKLTLTDRQMANMTLVEKRRWVSTAEAIRTAHANHTPTTISEDNHLITSWLLHPNHEPNSA